MESTVERQNSEARIPCTMLLMHKEQEENPGVSKTRNSQRSHSMTILFKTFKTNHKFKKLR